MGIPTSEFSGGKKKSVTGETLHHAPGTEFACGATVGSCDHFASILEKVQSRGPAFDPLAHCYEDQLT